MEAFVFFEESMELSRRFRAGCRGLAQQGVRVDARTRCGDTALLIAANGGAVEIVDKLLARRADKDVQNQFGDTALIIAARNGNVVLARRLLSAAASTLLRNKDRMTATDVAGARSFASLTSLLSGA